LVDPRAPDFVDPRKKARGDRTVMAIDAATRDGEPDDGALLAVG
jgi:hypothetical protein